MTKIKRLKYTKKIRKKRRDGVIQGYWVGRRPKKTKNISPKVNSRGGRTIGIGYKKEVVKIARRVFFSFHYTRDAWRVAQVRNCNVVAGYEKNPFYDKADWEKIKKQGNQAIKNWIEKQLSGTSVTVVLIGKETSKRPWVKHEIKRSVELGKGLIGIDISKIKDQDGKTDDAGANPLPAGFKKYLWNKDNGRENLGKWIEQATQ